MITTKELDSLIICRKCHTLHKKIPLKNNREALCSNCGLLLYQRDDKIIEKTLALVIASAIALTVAFQFTIVTINIKGLEQSLTLGSLFVVLAEHREYVVGLIFFFLIVLFPIMIIGSMFTLLFLMKIKQGGYLTKRLLILVAHIRPWSMIDIFFLSLLVAMVKLFDYANIELGVSFIAFIFTLILDIIVTKSIGFHDLWEIHNKIYGEVNE